MSSDNNNLKVEVRKGVLIYKASKGQLKDVDEEAQKIKEDINESRQQNPQNQSFTRLQKSDAGFSISIIP